MIIPNFFSLVASILVLLLIFPKKHSEDNMIYLI